MENINIVDRLEKQVRMVRRGLLSALEANCYIMGYCQSLCDIGIIAEDDFITLSYTYVKKVMEI